MKGKVVKEFIVQKARLNEDKTSLQEPNYRTVRVGETVTILQENQSFLGVECYDVVTNDGYNCRVWINCIEIIN